MPSRRPHPAHAATIIGGLCLALFLAACGKQDAESPATPAPSTAETAPPPVAAGQPAPLAPGTPLTAEQKNAVLGITLNQMARAQAAGLGDGRVILNGAWDYTGYSYLAPDPNAPIPVRMVAVDVTVEGHNAAFDFDDIEIVDGVSLVSYASDPHLTILSPEGKPLPDDSPVPLAPNPTRVLLIYAFPKETPTFLLYYWGKNLLGEPRPFEKTGWGLPYPDAGTEANDPAPAPKDGGQ